MTHNIIKELPESERPYEKYLRYGPRALTDADLIAIILKTGTKDSNSMDIARQILSVNRGNLLNLYDLSYEDLMRFHGIGKVKAIQLKAAAELSIRISSTAREHQLQMNNPETVAEFFMEQMRHLSSEHVYCACFDTRCNYLGYDQVSVGSVNYSIVSPREVMIRALSRNAVSLVLLHNHPSGDPSPSQDDIELTKRMRDAAELLGLQLSDHIIIGDNCYFSFLDHHLLDN